MKGFIPKVSIYRHTFIYFVYKNDQANNKDHESILTFDKRNSHNFWSIKREGVYVYNLESID